MPRGLFWYDCARFLYTEFVEEIKSVNLKPCNREKDFEPVATDPDYRRMGLGKAVVLESMRRTQAEGAEVAWVGSGQEFYKAMGFEKMFKFDVWVKFLD